MLDRDMRYLQVSDRFCEDYSVDSSQILGRSHYEVFPDIPQAWKEMHRQGLQGNCEPKRTAGIVKMAPRGFAGRFVRGRRPADLAGILIFAEDISRRKEMEWLLQAMSRKLIEAQEQERIRIARDLHDDIAQRLSLLANELKELQQSPPPSESKVLARMGAVQERTHRNSERCPNDVARTALFQT